MTNDELITDNQEPRVAATLDVHPASDAERIDIYRNVHEFWGRGLSLDEHVAWRLDSVQHNRATWIAGCLDGDVVASLGCYPLQFRVHGEIVPGIAIAAVHTLPEFRGRGFAPQMFDWLHDYYRDRGVKIGLLYSDIGAAYYARLGYMECPSFEAWMDVNSGVEEQESCSWRLEPLIASDDVAFLRESELCNRASLAIAIHRDEDYWNYLIQKDPADLYFGVIDAGGARVGYVRISATREALPDGGEPRIVWKIRDVALIDPSAETFCSVLRATVRMADSTGVASLGGWMPDSAGVRAMTDVTPRTDEITMLKSLSPEIELDAATISAAQHFQEIDHV